MAIGSEKPPSADLSDAFTDALAEEGVPKLPGVIAQARKAGVDLSSYRVNGTLLLQYALDEATFELPAGLKPIELLLGAGCDPCAPAATSAASEPVRFVSVWYATSMRGVAVAARRIAGLRRCKHRTLLL